MAELPRAAVKVGDLAGWVAFLGERVGLAVVEHRAAEDVALVRTLRGALLLYAGPNAGELAGYFGGQSVAPAPPDGLAFVADDVDALGANLRARGVSDARLTESAWGDRTLSVPAPEGFTLRFTQAVERPPAEVLSLYRSGPRELDDALAGADVDLRLEPGDWTIRQIAHHLIDGDLLFLGRMQMALAEPGKRYAQNWPTGNELAPASLDYATRSLETGLGLFRALRAHVAALAEGLSDAWERSTLDADGRSTRFGEDLSLVTRHALEHVAEIREIRRVHGR